MSVHGQPGPVAVNRPPAAPGQRLSYLDPAPGAPTRRNLDPEVQQEINNLTAELVNALRKYRAAKGVFERRKAELIDQYGDTAEADIAGKSDYRRARAVSDCNWYRGEVMVASNALIALQGLTGGRL